MTQIVGDSTTNFANTIADLLKSGNTVNALTLFTDNKHRAEVYNNSWDLVPIISQYLTKTCERDHIKVFKCCEKLMEIVASTSKPEEVLLQFIEEIEGASDDTQFLMLIKPLRMVLVRVPDKRLTSLAWCFNAIRTYLEKIETPDDSCYSDDSNDRVLYDSNEDVSRINFLYHDLVQFCHTFVEELMNLPADITGGERTKILSKFLIDLLGKPLCYLDMEPHKSTRPKARLIADDLVRKIIEITHDPFVYLEMRDNRPHSELYKPCNLSLGVFYYVVIALGECYDIRPKIYDPLYILHNSLQPIIALLGQSHKFLVEKGVNLIESILTSIDSASLPYDLLDCDDHPTFCVTLSHVIVYNESQTLRKRSLDVLRKYLWSFEHKGRYLITRNLFKAVSHSGLRGYLVTQYKQMMIATSADSPYYRGGNLLNVLEDFTRLPQSEETDLVDNSDEIVSTLNLVRFLVISSEDCEFDSYVEELEARYFKQLRSGIRLSRAHYELGIRDVKKDKVNGRDIEVSVSGKAVICELSDDSKVEVMKMGLTTLDVIDSLLSRVEECVAVRRAKVNKRNVV